MLGILITLCCGILIGAALVIGYLLIEFMFVLYGWSWPWDRRR